MRGWTVGLVGAALLVVGIGIAVVVALAASDDGTTIVELEVGDCFDLPDDAPDEELRSVDVVDCASPHLAEVVSDGLLDTDTPYPDDDELFTQVEQACRASNPRRSVSCRSRRRRRCGSRSTDGSCVSRSRTAVTRSRGRSSPADRAKSAARC